MRKPKQTRERSWTAHHEAAHAVASYRLRPNAERPSTSIIPNEDTLGRHVSENEFDSGLRRDAQTGELYVDHREIEGVIIELLAGYFGGVRAGCPIPREKLGARSDDERAADLLKRVGGKRATFRKRAARFVQHEWKAISAVARELLKRETLDDMELELIVDLLGRPAETRAALERYRALAESARRASPSP